MFQLKLIIFSQLRLSINVKGENVHSGSVEWNKKIKGATAGGVFIFVNSF